MGLSVLALLALFVAGEGAAGTSGPTSTESTGAESSSAAPSRYRLVDDAGRPFALVRPRVDLTPPPLPPAWMPILYPPPLPPPPPPESPYDRRARMDRIRLNDNLANAALAVGGAALLTTIILDFLRH